MDWLLEKLFSIPIIGDILRIVFIVGVILLFLLLILSAFTGGKEHTIGYPDKSDR